MSIMHNHNQSDRIKILNDLYLHILGRPVDAIGIKTYLSYIYKKNGIQYISRSLINSNEYKKHKTLNTATIKVVDGASYKQDPQIYHSLSHKNILLLSLIKNCSHNIEHIKNLLIDLEQHFQHVNYFYFTNNNTDNTYDELRKLQDTNPNIDGILYHDEDYAITHNDHIINRNTKFAIYRNILFDGSIQKFGQNHDYIVVFDADFSTPPTAEQIIQSICIEEQNWSYISGNYCYKTSNYYYDIFALRLPNQSKDIEKVYPDFNKYYGINHNWINQHYIFNGYVPTQASFGGVCIYKAKELYDIYNSNNKLYDENINYTQCEHITLSDKLQNLKLINANMHIESNEYLTTLNNNTYVFIPRDAGFFSVFNFMIGTIMKGIKAYPLFNKNIFLKYHKHNPRHFCYWSNSNNSWMDFFEPIKYFPTDITHDNLLMHNHMMIDGSHIADKTFTHPDDIKSLFMDSQKFDIWRNNTHKIYKQYIHFNDELIKQSDEIMDRTIKNKNNIIGVHYRHPSHSVESGDIYLRQYFDIIDQLIKEHPNSSIFLASDTDFGILAFKQKYKHKISYIKDINRLNLDNILSWAYAMKSQHNINDVGFIDNKGYELHHQISETNNTDNYKMTKDLLLEILCLSKCHHLIHTISNIALSISYINPTIQLHTIL